MDLTDDGPFICQLDGHDDSILDDISDDESEKDESIKSMNKQVNIINTNARSLCPKIDSLVDCFEELNGTVGIVTETWLCLLYTSPSPRDRQKSRMPSSA